MGKVIGIDLGGTSIYGGVIDPQGNIVRKAERKTGDGNSREGLLNLIISLIEELWDKDILGIGIGSPGFINSKEGRVLHIGGNIKGWAYTDIKGYLGRKFPNLPIYVENDANLAGLCEHWIGAAKGLKSFLMLTLGTGVGGAIYGEKEGLLRGYNYQGAELGHAILYPNGIRCHCGQRGCVERYISGRAIERKYARISGRSKKGKDIFKDYQRDRLAQEVVDKFCQDLAIYMVSLKNTFDPQAIIIGGGVINSKEYWWSKMLEYYRKHSNDLNSLKISPALYLNDAGMIGGGRIVYIKEDR